jgi:2-C-methyl-D-erythritol 2,4-cyclodiphosphate synthase
MELEHDKGPVGHSDGDTLLHAVTDAILGALGEPDIGRLFPDTAPENEGADSKIFLEEAVRRMDSRGLRIGNMDATIICERPKIAPHADRMSAGLAEILGCDPGQINIKGKTHERVDAVGEGRAIEVHVVALLIPLD